MAKSRGKISKHPKYDDPSAFSMRWPKIKEVPNTKTMMALTGHIERTFKMGKVLAAVTYPDNTLPAYFMSVRRDDRLPSWDEVVWLKYNLLPDSVVMSLILPNLDSYINLEGTDQHYVLTMEQARWALHPHPACLECGRELVSVGSEPPLVSMVCSNCKSEPVTINMNTWNEDHGSGLKSKWKPT